MSMLIDYDGDKWWLRIMGIGASTNVKEIRIDQTDAKWESYPSSASSRRSSRGRGLGNLGKRWINSAETAANNRRLQQLNAALESAEKRAQDAEQRVRQLERELATLELRNMELADEATWLRKQLSDRPEVPLSERPPTGTLKNSGATGGAAVTTVDTLDAYRLKQNQYVSKLESQIKLYEEDILKLKTKMNKETQRLQVELEDQKHRSEKEVRSLDNRLIEAHKLNQKYEEVISTKISSDTVSQLRNEVSIEIGTGAIALVAASNSTGIGTSDTLNQSKSRAQLILELTEQISMQQDKIRYLEEEITRRDSELSHMKSLMQKGDEGAVLTASIRKASKASTVSSNRAASTVRISSSTKTARSESNSSMANASASGGHVVANEDEIEALLNNPAMIYEPDESDEEKSRQKPKADPDERTGPMNLSASQDLQQQIMNSSLKSVPTSWRKEPPTASASALPPSGANQKRIISIVNTVDGNNLAGNISQPPTTTSRPKTMAGSRQRVSPAPRRQHTVENINTDQIESISKPSADNASPISLGSRTHSAPMFSFKPRPSSKEAKRTALSTGASINSADYPPPIDLEEEVIELSQETRRKETPKKVHTLADVVRRKNSDSIEVLSLHDQETGYGQLATPGSESALGYDSSNAQYEDEGDIEDGDDDEQNPDDEYNSDQEIRRRFEERWKKSTANLTDPNEDTEPRVGRQKIPRPPAGGGVGQAAPSTLAGNSADQKRSSTSAKSQDSGFLGDSCASTNSLSLWKGRNKRQKSLQQAAYDPLDVDKLLEM